ncbi:MAG: 50S ribosomal protein L22 [Candidatus Peribacteraceae bacterium]|nr:50S ribosomal protein L22 [Candidatus Peribacteraceae bacterium]
MKAYLSSARIAPKKLAVIAKMVRGLSVPDAISALSRTNKKGARLIEALLKSAMANAEHNDKQDAQMLIVKTIVVNQAQSYRRGVPMARGRSRPLRHFLSHVSLTLGVMDTDEAEEGKGKKRQKTAQKPSQDAKKQVQGSTAAKSRTKKTSSTSTSSPTSSAS